MIQIRFNEDDDDFNCQLQLSLWNHHCHHSMSMYINSQNHHRIADLTDQSGISNSKSNSDSEDFQAFYEMM